MHVVSLFTFEVCLTLSLHKKALILSRAHDPTGDTSHFDHRMSTGRKKPKEATHEETSSRPQRSGCSLRRGTAARNFAMSLQAQGTSGHQAEVHDSIGSRSGRSRECREEFGQPQGREQQNEANRHCGVYVSVGSRQSLSYAEEMLADAAHVHPSCLWLADNDRSQKVSCGANDEEAHQEEHSNVVAQLTWRCSTPKKLGASVANIFS